MSSSWPLVALGELASNEESAVAIGPFGSRMKAENYTDTGVSVVRGQNLTASGRIEGDFVFVTEEFASELGSASLRQNDIVLPHRGAIGRAALVPEGKYLMSTSLMRIRLDEGLVLPKFALYCLLSAAGRAEILKFASTVGTPGIGQPLTSLRQVRIPLPPLDEQRRIAGVLGALDDLIEVNRKLATDCDALAEASWRRAVAGLVPTHRLSDHASVVLGGTPSRARSDYWGGEVPWLNSGKANEFRVIAPSERITTLGRDKSSTKLMPAGTTIVAITGATLGQVSRLEIDACGNQSLVGIYSDVPAVRDFLYYAVRDQIDVLLRSATGGAQQHVNKSNAEELLLRWLPEPALRAWHQSAEPLLIACAQLLFEIDELSRTRDELLPLLMSGRVRVGDVAA